jgi:hypothetical protein
MPVRDGLADAPLAAIAMLPRPAAVAVVDGEAMAGAYALDGVLVGGWRPALPGYERRDEASIRHEHMFASGADVDSVHAGGHPAVDEQRDAGDVAGLL